MDRLLADVFLEAHSQPTPVLWLDLDATDDSLHGHREGQFFHGYYKSYCYLPLYIFCGAQLLGARLRPAHCDAAAGSVTELARREKLAAQLDAACERLARQAKARAGREQAEYARKVAAREKRRGRAKGGRIKPPDDTPPPTAQSNLTDADSGLMRRNKQSAYEQAYNAQAVVDADGSQLVLGTRVSQCASDRGELVADIDSVPPRLGTPAQVLADNGYATETEVATLTGREIDVMVAVGTAPAA